MHTPQIHTAQTRRRLTLAEAQNEYEAQVRQTLGVTREDVEMDFVSFGLLATNAVGLARQAAKHLHGLSCEHGKADVVATARMIGDVLAEQFGLSQDAAIVLDLMIEAERV